MGLINYCNYTALIAIIIQIICYSNQFALQVILLKPLWYGFGIEVIILNVLAITAFYRANHNSQKYEQDDEDISSYCKQCKRKIVARDHHCVFIGQCVDAKNFRFYLSYTFYSYTLSALLILRFILEWKGTLFILYWGFLSLKISFLFGILSGAYFTVMTGSLFVGSLKRILQNITKIDEIKDRKQPKYSRFQLFKKIFSPIATYRQFKQNWKQINRNDFKVLEILFPFI